MSKLIEYIKEEEFEKILHAEKKKNFKLAYLLAFGSGLRISEIIGYKRKDDKEIKALEPSKIDIPAHEIRIIGGKNMKDRIAPLFPNFKEEYLKLLPLKIKRSTLQAHFKITAKKATGKNLHFHQLRHGFAEASIKAGVDLNSLRQALGHSRLDTTQIYLSSNPEDMKNKFRKAWGEIKDE